MRRPCRFPLGACGDGPPAARPRLPGTHWRRLGRSACQGLVVASGVFLRLKPGVVRNRSR
jgi:hypothetical protein